MKDCIKCSECGKKIEADKVDYSIFDSDSGEKRLRIRTVAFCNGCNERTIHRVSFNIEGTAENCFVTLRDKMHSRTTEECVDLAVRTCVEAI